MGCLFPDNIVVARITATVTEKHITHGQLGESLAIGSINTRCDMSPYHKLELV